MALTKEQLLEFRQDALQQKQRYLDGLQQAIGALAMLDFLIEQAQKKEQADA